MTPGRQKYRAAPVTVDGHRFHSKKECRRYLELRDAERRGEITNLRLQVKYDLVVNLVYVGRYTADFTYQSNGRLVVEDVKSPATRKIRDYPLRKKLMKAVHGVDILET